MPARQRTHLHERLRSTCCTRICLYLEPRGGLLAECCRYIPHKISPPSSRAQRAERDPPSRQTMSDDSPVEEFRRPVTRPPSQRTETFSPSLLSNIRTINKISNQYLQFTYQTKIIIYIRFSGFFLPCSPQTRMRERQWAGCLRLSVEMFTYKTYVGTRPLQRVGRQARHHTLSF